MSESVKQTIDSLVYEWLAHNPAKFPKSFGANETTIEWLKNSLPRIGLPDPEPEWIRLRVDTKLSFLGMQIVADESIPRGELHVRNAEGKLLEVLYLPAANIPQFDD